MSLRLRLNALMKMRLKPAPLSVMTSLLNHCDSQTGLSHPGAPLIAEEAGLSERQVRRILCSLVGARRIAPMGKTRNGTGATTIYRLNFYFEASPAKDVTAEFSPDISSSVGIFLPVSHDTSPDISHDKSSSYKTNKGLNTVNSGEHRFPPSRAMGGTNGKQSKLDQAIANIAAVRAQRR